MKIIRSVSSLALLAVVVASCYLFAVTRAPQQGGRILALYAEGDALTAVDLFENDPALAMDFEDKFALVRSYFLLDRMREAKQVVDVLLKEQPDNSDIRAYSAALAPGYSMAIKAISEAKELSEEETLLLKLSAASTNRRYQDALRLIQSNPDLPHLLDTSELRLYNLLRARVYFNTEMYDQAHKVLAKSVEMFSDFAPLYELLIKVKVRRNALAGLAEDINVYEALGGSEFTIEFNRGILYERSGDLKKAIEHYTNAIELKPKLGKIYLRRGNCYRYTDQKKLAAEDYSVAYNNDPSLAEALVNLAILKMESGEYRVARQLYDEVVSSHPDFQSGYVERGRFLHANGLVELAEQDYVKAMELAPTDPYCSYLAALLHVEHMNLERAKRFIDITMQRDSSYPRIYVVLGDYHRLKGDDRAAIAEYNNALRLDGRNLEALRKLAQVYIEVREPANAVNAASRALQVYDKDLFSMYYLGLGRLGRAKLAKHRPSSSRF
ncbi:MAG: tetratricopeptide repeat protein [Planctomycetota bacterium]|nr:tetratricopeptide repeat protein [Planctomycetota bacterium]